MTPPVMLLYVWIGATLVVTAIILGVRYKRNKPLSTLQLANFVSLALAVYATISSLQLIYSAFTVQQLQTLLGAENIPALVLGGVAVIWVSIKEIWNLL